MRVDPPHNDGVSGRHQVYHWQGTPYEIGYGHGRTLAREIGEEVRPALAQFAVARGLSPEQAAARARRDWEPLFAQHTPRVLEEIRGLAAGSGIDKDVAFFAALHHGTKTPHATGQEPACSAFVCGAQCTEAGHVLIGQTKDTTAPLTRYRIMTRVDEEGNGAVLLNYPGWAVNIGMTSRGLAFTGNSLYGRAPRVDPAPTALLRRLVLERGSVDEVLSCIQGLSFDNGCTIVADRGGRAVCIESCAGETVVRDVTGLAFGHANSILDPRLKEYEDEHLGSPSSPMRQEVLDRLLATHSGHITVEDAKRFLADHTGFPLSICRHRSDRDPLWTTAAFVADVTSGNMHIAVGHPCVAPFHCYRVPRPRPDAVEEGKA